MKCPRCNEEFRLTWGVYFKAPTGKYTCSACGAGLKGRHAWHYAPMMVAGCCLVGLPLALLGHFHYGRTGAIGGWALGALLSGFPVDKYLEERFSRLSEAKETAHDGRAKEESETPTASENAD